MNTITLTLISSVLGGVAIAITSFYLNWLKTRVKPSKELKLARYKDVIEWGWDGHKLLDKLIKLDYAVVPQLNEEREGTIDQWAPVFMEHPYSWCLLVTRPKEIVGYWHFSAVKPAVAERIRQGKLQDSEITLDAIEDLDNLGCYVGYFTLIGILEEHRSLGFPLLVEAFFNELATLGERGIYFSKFLANAYTDKGKNLCNSVGMHPVTPHADYGTVYEVKLIPWPGSLRHKGFSKAEEAYAYATVENE